MRHAFLGDRNQPELAATVRASYFTTATTQAHDKSDSKEVSTGDRSDDSDNSYSGTRNYTTEAHGKKDN